MVVFLMRKLQPLKHIVNTNLQSKNSMVNIYLSIYLSYVAGVRFPSNLVHVISACWRYLCSSPLSSSSRSPFIISLPLSPSALRSNKKRTESVGVDRCFTHAAAQLTGRRDEEKEGEEDRGRQKERRWDGVRKREAERRKRESRREKRVFCVCSCSADWEDGEQNRMCSMCVCVRSRVCISVHMLCVAACTRLNVHRSSRMHSHGRMWRKEATQGVGELCFLSEMEVALT